jgi:ABC-type polar amino acid transport system ATPase subunit
VARPIGVSGRASGQDGRVTGPVLAVDGVRLSRGARNILDGVSLGMGRQEIVALIGLSGAGKTTLLRCIAGLERFDAGTIAVGDAILHAHTASRQARRALHQQVGMVFQFHYLFEHLSALDNVCLAPVTVQRVPRPDAVARATTLLDQLGVGHRARALPRELSGGEAQRVAIARALAVAPPLILLDEPTASLDPARRHELAHALRSLAAAGQTLLMTSHDEEFVGACASQVVVLADGQIAESGDPHDVLQQPRTAATRARLNSNGGTDPESERVG